MNIVATRMLTAIRSAIVPPLCVCCREPEPSGSALCADCRNRLEPISDPRCLCCGAPGSDAAGCGECRGRNLNFDRAWAGFRYEGVGRDVVRALKIRARIAAAPAMAEQIAARAPAGLLRGTLVPVPVHRQRQRREGFNQAAELARALGRICAVQTAAVLERDGSGRQVGLERRARIANARDSVSALPAASKIDTAILIDDVYTTGATLDACAHALRAAGVERIEALSFARAVRH